MQYPNIQILLIEPYNMKSVLFSLLSEIGYKIAISNALASTHELLLKTPVDLIICDNKLEIQNGFSIFQNLRNLLLPTGIPFFLFLEKFEKVDILVGLEMGIDNFIIGPIDKTSVIAKIENEMKKKYEVNIFQTQKFKSYFNASAIAMMYLTNNKIEKMNQAFCQLYEIIEIDLLNKPVSEVFNLFDNQDNVLSYRRYKNGLINGCILLNVTCCSNDDLMFDLFFYRTNDSADDDFVEILPAEHRKVAESLANKSNKIEFMMNMEGNKMDRIILTERETEVFELSAKGLPIKGIANKLELSERTIEKHRSNIMAKVNAKNMIEAIIHIQKDNNKTEFTN